MLKIIISTISLVSLCLLILITNLTTPTSAGPLLIIVVLSLIYMSSFGLVTFLMYFFSKLVSRMFLLLMTRKPFIPLTLKNACIYSAIISTTPVMILALKSVGASGVYEIILVFLFVIIGCLYISKRIR